MPHTGFLQNALLFQPACLNRDKLRRRIEGRTILVTGASSGIGEQLVRLLADFDVHIVAVARREERLQAIREDVGAGPARVSVFPADLRDPDQLASLIGFLQGLPDGLDVFVSNAGHSIRRSIADSLDRFHDFSRTMGINYFAPVRLVLSLAPALARRRGHIVSVSTVSALLPPVPQWAAYLASKTAFDVWFRSAAPELNGMGISTSTVYLPLVRTPMIEPTTAYRHWPALSPEYAARVIARSLYAGKRAYKPWWLAFARPVAPLAARHAFSRHP